MNLLRRLYNWTLKKSHHPKASWFLAFIAFLESSFFPIPPDIILIPMILANRLKAWLFALVCTFSSVLGGLFGYIIGFFFYNSIGILIINYYSLSNKFNELETYYNEFGFWIVLGAGFTPFPFKLITIASGLFGLNIFLFLSVAFLARGLRFFLLAWLLKIFGNYILKFIDKYFNLLAMLFFILLILSFAVIKYL
tara:strand:+ start:613 stop:1197 length:585 start_codon:yes stop_codon:yes gene_type:complete